MDCLLICVGLYRHLMVCQDITQRQTDHQMSEYQARYVVQ